MDVDLTQPSDVVPTQPTPQMDTSLASLGVDISTASAQSSILSDTSSVLAVAGTQTSTSQGEQGTIHIDISHHLWLGFEANAP